MEVENKFVLCAVGQSYTLLNPLKQGKLFTKEDALFLAAWLVALADPTQEVFGEYLNSVMEL